MQLSKCMICHWSLCLWARECASGSCYLCCSVIRANFLLCLPSQFLAKPTACLAAFIKILNTILPVCRQADPAAIIRLLNSIHVPPATEVRAVLEQPVPNRLNGNFSWFSAGYNYGVWKSILISRGIGFQTVSARAWKFDLLLNKLGKEGSRQLAQQILPQSAQQLKYVLSHLQL